MINVKEMLNSYINRNKFCQGANNGDLLVICKDGKFTAHLDVIKNVSNYVKDITDNNLNSNKGNKISDSENVNDDLICGVSKTQILLSDFKIEIVKPIFDWLYQPLESIKEKTSNLHNFENFFQVFKLIKFLKLNIDYDKTLNLYYNYVKEQINCSLCVKKDWHILLYFIDGNDDKYLKLIKNDIFMRSKKEIRNYVISYMLDITHSEYLGDNNIKKLNMFDQFLKSDKYPLSKVLKYEIIVISLAMCNNE